MSNRSSHSPSQWLTLQEAAGLLGVHQNTLRRWADAGHVSVHRTPGGHRRFKRAVIEQLCPETALPAEIPERYNSVVNANGSLLVAADKTGGSVNIIERLFLVGFDHKVTPRPIRERVAGAELTPTEVHRVLSACLPDAPGNRKFGVAVLSTCHRTEVYGSAPSPEAAVAALLNWLQPITGLSQGDIECNVRIFRGRDAARHLCEVAAGMHSVVRGESQILGQIKHALQHALDHRTMDATMATLFRTAVESGKHVRTKAPIGVASISLADMAIDMLTEEACLQVATTPVIVGSGRMATLVVARLYALGHNRFVVVSRDPHAAQRLHVSEEMDFHVVPPDRLEHVLSQAQLAFFCNRSPHPLVGQAEIDRVAELNRGHGHLTLVDLAHPPAVAINTLPIGVRLINLAKLEQAGASEAAFDIRAQEAVSLIDASVASFERWCRERPAAPLIAATNDQIRQIAAAELQHALAKLPDADAQTQATLEDLARRIAGRAAHAAITALKQQAKAE